MQHQRCQQAVFLNRFPTLQVSTIYYEVIDLPLPEYESLMNFKVPSPPGSTPGLNCPLLSLCLRACLASPLDWARAASLPLPAPLLSAAPPHPPPHPLLPVRQIAYHNRTLEEVSQHSVRISKAATVEELLEELRRQLPAEAQDRPLRLMEVYQARPCGVSGDRRRRRLARRHSASLARAAQHPHLGATCAFLCACCLAEHCGLAACSPPNRTRLLPSARGAPAVEDLAAV